MSPSSAVSVVGLGNLGLAIATGLHRQGWTVRGFDSSPSRLEAASRRGVSAVAAQEVADSPWILLVVPDEVAIRELLYAGGLRGRLTSNHVVVCHSTLLPARAQELSEEVTSTGARFLDVPVSGGPDRAERGELCLFVAGDPSAVATVRPLLDAEGSDLFEVGPVGAGSATKLANQLVMFSAQAALFEGLRLAGAYGVSEQSVLAALQAATGDTWVGRNWGFFDRVAADYNQAGVPVASRPWAKDMAEIVAAGADRDLSLPLAELVSRVIATAIEDHATAATVGSRR